MLLFGELMGREFLPNMKLIRVHLREPYDFVFWQFLTVTEQSTPNPQIASQLRTEGRATFDGPTSAFNRYGIGEFKADGERILDDFDERLGIKKANTPDLLVCWTFETGVVEDRDWSVAECSDSEAMFPLQTHVWTPSGRQTRRRILPVLALDRAIRGLIDRGELEEADPNWADRLPENYY
jgi:hypothetical protein